MRLFLFACNPIMGIRESGQETSSPKHLTPLPGKSNKEGQRCPWAGLGGPGLAEVCLQPLGPDVASWVPAHCGGGSHTSSELRHIFIQPYQKRQGGTH